MGEQSSVNTVFQTLRQAAVQIPDPTPPRRVRDLEIDEFWSLIQSKKRQHWGWYGWDRLRKQITTFVLGWRTDASCRRLVQKHAACQIRTYHTDDWQSF